MRLHVRVAFTGKKAQPHSERMGDDEHEHRKGAQRRCDQMIAERGVTSPVCLALCSSHGEHCNPVQTTCRKSRCFGQGGLTALWADSACGAASYRAEESFRVRLKGVGTWRGDPTLLGGLMREAHVFPPSFAKRTGEVDRRAAPRRWGQPQRVYKKTVGVCLPFVRRLPPPSRDFAAIHLPQRASRIEGGKVRRRPPPACL